MPPKDNKPFYQNTCDSHAEQITDLSARVAVVESKTDTNKDDITEIKGDIKQLIELNTTLKTDMKWTLWVASFAGSAIFKIVTGLFTGFVAITHK